MHLSQFFHQRRKRQDNSALLIVNLGFSEQGLLINSALFLARFHRNYTRPVNIWAKKKGTRTDWSWKLSVSAKFIT